MLMREDFHDINSALVEVGISPVSTEDWNCSKFHATRGIYGRVAPLLDRNFDGDQYDEHIRGIREAS